MLGVRNDRRYAYEGAYFDVSEELWSGTDAEDLAGGATIEIPEASVVVRGAWAVYGRCATYFACVRDSLKNILLDVGKRIEQRELISSDSFWRKFILKAVESKKTEPLLWDFKETLTMWHVKQDPERERAKVTFAEDVASLANAKKGVLVIRVSDQPREIVGAGGRELESRLMVAQQVVARNIDYDRNLVSFQQIVLPGKNGETVCLVMVVAQACDVVGVHDRNGKYTYPIRRETGIERIARRDLERYKTNTTSDNYDFVRDLHRFVVDD